MSDKEFLWVMVLLMFTTMAFQKLMLFSIFLSFLVFWEWVSKTEWNNMEVVTDE